MKKFLASILTAAIAFSCGAGIILTTDTADAKPAKTKDAKDNGKDTKDAKKKAPALNDVLGDLKWGMSAEKTKKLLADKIMNDFSAKIEGNTDLQYVDNLRKTHSDRVENMQKSYQMLTRDNSAALSVSIVGEEFIPDAGEAMLIQREDIASKYFFFLNDKLYKVAVVYDSAYLGPIAFDTFVATTAQKYGPAKDEVWDDDANFIEAIWTDKTDVKLAVKNKYSSYNTFLMVFSDDAVEKTLQAKHKEYYAALNSGPEVSSAIDDLTSDSTDAGGSSVDALLGKTTKVDLLAGLSQEDIDVINGVTTQEELEKKKKEKAKKERKKDNTKAKKGLEIY
ncbi:MAG: hypothetical protein II767_06400 [Proteobacteria bacterium]|nr:hypothetical protein [Pseudomonadota bacterium]MBQ4359869.1 hypothetical protein [Pseudomonadota bacterium]